MRTTAGAPPIVRLSSPPTAVMSSGQIAVYRFAEFEVEIEELPGGHARRSLRYRGEEVNVEPQTLKLLSLIIERRRNMLSREEIAQGMWTGKGDRGIDHRIDGAVNKLRRTLNRSCEGAGAYVFTVRGVGVRLDADLEVTVRPVQSAPTETPKAAQAARREVVGMVAPRDSDGEADVPGATATTVAVSVVFGIMVGLALLVEVAYEWSTYSSWVMPTSVALAFGAGAAAFAALRHIRGRARAGMANTLGSSALLLVGSSILIALAIAPVLPNDALVAARVQTMAARVGWVKSVGEALFLPMLALVPLHTVFLLEHHLRNGGRHAVRELLLELPGRVAPPGVLYVAPRVAWMVFLVVTGGWLVANARLFESLEPRRYYGLFLALDFARVALGLLMLLWVLVWYLIVLTYLKRQAADATTPIAPN